MNKKKNSNAETSKPIKLGFIFEDKYQKDPSDLSLDEINEIIFKSKKPKVSAVDTSIVTSRGNVFAIRDYSEIINKEFDEVIKE